MKLFKSEVVCEKISRAETDCEGDALKNIL
jgi:hypothetical protein